MEDSEFVMLRNRFVFALIIVPVFIIPLIAFIVNKFSFRESSINEVIKNKQSVVLLIVDNDCNYCNKVNSLLKKSKVNYRKIKRDYNGIYDDTLDKLNISDMDVVPPTIIYIKKGKVYSSLVDINNEDELLTFLENYKLVRN